MTKEVLTLALEALELAHPRFGIGTEKHKQAIAALRLAIDVQNMASESTYKEAIANHIEDNLVMVQEPVAWMSNKDFEPIRIRIMQEAYNLADRNDSEGYNAIKEMCGEVQKMLPSKREWFRLTDEEIEECWDGDLSPYKMQCIREIEAKLKAKNAHHN
jgi:hypothetical protein